MLSEADGDLWLVRLDGSPRALHLTRQVTLDALGLDDRISTGRVGRGRPDPLLEVCGELADRIWDWYDPDTPALLYRTRTRPSGRSLAFTRHAAWTAIHGGRLGDAVALHTELVLRAGFSVPDHWLY